jgi:hypothetical protein
LRRIALFVMLGALVMTVPAVAYKTPKPPKVHKPHKPHKPHKSRSCKVRTVGYDARGGLVLAGTHLSLVGHHRYSGTIEVVVTKANHRAPTGDQSFTVVDGRVRFAHPLSASGLADGDRVKLQGHITKLPKRCAGGGFTPTITIRKLDIRRPTKPKH